MKKSKVQEIPLAYIFEEEIGDFPLALNEEKSFEKDSKWDNFCRGVKGGGVIFTCVGIVLKCFMGSL